MWFSARGEDSLEQALAIRDSHIAGNILILAPDLFYYEVTNAIVHKKSIPLDAVQSAVASIFDLGITTVPVDAALLTKSVSLARKLSITVYDACYLALAKDTASPLVTANPRHQNKGTGCEVIPLEKWLETSYGK
jgi:predicted nucleic acid-binding protein